MVAVESEFEDATKMRLIIQLKFTSDGCAAPPSLLRNGGVTSSGEHQLLRLYNELPIK